VRVITQLGATSPDRALVVEAYPDVELIDFTGGEPPPGLAADAFFGGYMGWPDILGWLDAAAVRWVQLSGTGVDNVPREVFDGRTVTCARGASAVPISEFVMAAILSFAKRLPTAFLHEPPKYWNFPIPQFDAVAGSTLGLVGLGGIGAAIARRARAFDMRVVAVRRTQTPSPVEGVEMVTALDELLPVVDHLVLAAPATDRTRGMIGAEALARVKPGVHIVNIARGSLIDQDALRAALDDDRVAQATLDTVTPEPLPAGHWLYEHPKVNVCAHVSWYSPALQRAAVEIFTDNLGRFIRGEPLQYIVDVSEGY
jgi:phosphoglycerate dehydrogenase-like enzyme